MQETDRTGELVIERHALQQMLLHALQSPDTCRGVFGGPQAAHISHAALTGSDEAEVIIEHSQADSLGLFYADLCGHAPDIARLGQLAAELQLALPRRCILLCLDTAGRMEARAFRQHSDSLVAESLEMAEDHTLSQAPASR